MSDKQLVEFVLDDGSVVVIEAESTKDPNAIRRATRPGEFTARATQTFEEALSRVRPATEAVLKQMWNLSERPDDIEVEFGLKISATAGAIIASGTIEANFVVTLKWSKEKPESGG